MKKRLMSFVLILLLFACGTDRISHRIYLFSQDKEQVITIINDYNHKKRVIALGKHKSKPKENFVELDVSGITDLGDEIGVCWNLSNMGWELVNDGAIILENKLDTTKYIVRVSWFKDEIGIPTPKYYWRKNCFTVGMLNHSNHKPKDNGFVLRD